MTQNPSHAITKVSQILEKGACILDIGAGRHLAHTKIFRKKGFVVDTCDFFHGSTYRGDFNKLDIPEEKYDMVWGSHVLEHQLNVGNFLTKCREVCKEGGIVCMTVPPRTTFTAGGHVTQWNPGMLVYNMVLAGIDCSNAHIKQYDYNQSVIGYKNSFKLPQLKYDSGDLHTLNKWLPKGLEYKKFGNFEGDIKEHNW
jgi:SAM-dependent methyltransferase